MILQFALGLWMCGVIIAAFLWLPPAKGFQYPEAARIIIFHVPNAMVAVIAFLVSTVYAVKYLKSRDLVNDAKSVASAELGLMFAILATLTGAIFAKIQWGTAWNWDPRETTMAILLMIYAAYFGLRSAVEGDERRAVLSSAYAIIAFVTVPFLIFILPRMLSSLHPSDTLTTRGGLGPQYRMVLSAAMIGFLGLYVWLFRLCSAIAVHRNQKKGV
ncbi:MAG: cytochrome c biogenesis protein CcsA [Armatimonadota bacterium]|nr:cytochrome c biogenesis protein CcsA [Armatimonadota bacterium]